MGETIQETSSSQQHEEAGLLTTSAVIDTQDNVSSTCRALMDTPPSPSPGLSSVSRKERRNGMWNIFEGVDSRVLEQLGLAEDLVLQLVTEADDTVTEHLSRTAGRSLSPNPANPNSCRCRRARILRSFSATVGEEVRADLQNRQRRNAVGNLFEILTPSQKLLLVEHLQEQVERLHCLCRPAPVQTPTLGDGNDVVLDLANFTTASPAVTTSSGSGMDNGPASPPPPAQGQVLCH